MEQLQALSLGRKLILGAGILLLIDTFLDWQHVSVSFGGEEIASGGQSAWHGFWGVMIGILTVALIAAVIAMMFGVQPPENVPQGLISLVLAGLVLLFAVIKVLADEAVHWPAYVGIVLAAVIAYGAWLNFQESGESLPSMPRTASAGAGAGAAGTAATPPPPPAPAEPAPMPPAETEPPPGDQTT